MKSGMTVSATFNYTRDTGVAPEIYFYEAPPGTMARGPGDDPREMAVLSGWDRAPSFALDREGFALREFRSRFQEWDDDAAIGARLYPEATEFVRHQVGARRVIVFDHTIRAKRNEKQQTSEHATSQRAPVMLVHCDYTPVSGPLRVKQLFPNESEELLGRRVAFYNFWKPLKRTVEEKPLAMCDATSSTDRDFITMKLHYRDRDGEIFVLRHWPQHPMVVLSADDAGSRDSAQDFDSETDGRTRFIGHSAFDDPDTPPDAPMRESIEIRTAALF
jgi:hypothetical protein